MSVCGEMTVRLSDVYTMISLMPKFSGVSIRNFEGELGALRGILVRIFRERRLKFKKVIFL